MIDYSFVMEWGDTTMISQGDVIEGFVDDIKPGPELPAECWNYAPVVGNHAFDILREMVRGNG
jgi:hypothetical protein